MMFSVVLIVDEAGEDFGFDEFVHAGGEGARQWVEKGFLVFLFSFGEHAHFAKFFVEPSVNFF